MCSQMLTPIWTSKAGNGAARSQAYQAKARAGLGAGHMDTSMTNFVGRGDQRCASGHSRAVKQQLAITSLCCGCQKP